MTAVLEKLGLDPAGGLDVNDEVELRNTKRLRNGLGTTLANLKSAPFSIPPTTVPDDVRSRAAKRELFRRAPAAALAEATWQEWAEGVVSRLSSAASRHIELRTLPRVAVIGEGGERLEAHDAIGTGGLIVGQSMLELAMHTGGATAEATSPEDLLERLHGGLGGSPVLSFSPEALRVSEDVLTHVLGHELIHMVRDDAVRKQAIAMEYVAEGVPADTLMKTLRRRNRAMENAADLLGCTLALEAGAGALSLAYLAFHAMRQGPGASMDTNHLPSVIRYERLYRHVQEWSASHPGSERVRSELQRLPSPDQLVAFLESRARCPAIEWR